MTAQTTSNVHVYDMDEDDEGCVRFCVSTNIPYFGDESARERLATTLESSEELLAALDRFASAYHQVTHPLTRFEVCDSPNCQIAWAAIAKARGLETVKS